MTTAQRKIIHIDMDCFYAAVEIRDNPTLADKPVAVGSQERRGVLCTANYIARQYGVHSAMATAIAYRHCPDLIVLPVNMSKYKQVSQSILNIFKEFSGMIEPLSLDEAYLDVTQCDLHQGSATWIAQAIQARILEQESLTASAGVSINKFLAKIASGWKKPKGLFVIPPEKIATFVMTLPVDKLFGVGKKTQEKLHAMNIHNCADLQQLSLKQLATNFGKFGEQLYYQCRGVDNRPVIPNRARKSLSAEQTFLHDLLDHGACLAIIKALYPKLLDRIQECAATLPIKNQYIKIKFADFKQTTAEVSSQSLHLDYYLQLFQMSYLSHTKAIRLIGLGLRFYDDSKLSSNVVQESLFENAF